jgi:hypothetical protein
MKLPPYTLKEAKELCVEYQHIVGLPFNDTCHGNVDMVLVTPYDQNSKNRFLMIYLMLNDANAALSLDYSGNNYDVLVIAGSAASIGMQQMSLCAWLQAHDKCCVAEGETSEIVPA